MTPERWQQVEEIYHAALDRQPEARGAFLNQACAGDSDLRREVESLLSHEEAGSALEDKVHRQAGQLVGESRKLASGTRLGHYNILAELGAGGMGEVYRARDTRLDRVAAIKVLPYDKLADPERRRRFVREAKSASALNHPNIVTVYEIDSDHGMDFIAMEYLDGQSLDKVVPARGLPIPLVLAYAIQIADGLAKAHAAGIVHRDLKPGNIMVTDEGRIKIVDFGLAKLMKDRAADADLPGTEPGMILGTAAYMSPEQAEGREADARSDIFSFGAVLYEMVTGRRAFPGDSWASTLAAIISREPKPIGEARPDVPPELEKLIARCVRKDRERRPRDAADLRVALLDLKEEPARRGWKMAAVAAGVAVLAAAIWLVIARSKNQAPLSVKPLTSYPGRTISPTFSPDGSQVAFSWNGEQQNNTDIYVKLVDTGAPLRLTANQDMDNWPAWSPDGRQIAFLRGSGIAARELMLISPLGGVERKLAGLRAGEGVNGEHWHAPAWTPDSKFLAVRDETAIVLVSVESGEKRTLTSPPAAWVGDYHPAVSPDGRTLAFLRMQSGPTGDMFVTSVQGGAKFRQLTRDNREMNGLAWALDGKEIVFSSRRGGESTLWRISASGGTPERLPAVGAHAVYPAIARQGQRAAFARSTMRTSFWRLDLSPEGLRRPPVRLVTSSRHDYAPMLSPNRGRIAFVSDRSGSDEIWVCDSQGANAVQLTSLGFVFHPYWSPDGKNIVFAARPADRTFLFALSADGGTPRQMNSEEGYNPSWSRDGRWIYFRSRRTGTPQMWKMPAEGGTAIQLTKGGGGPGIESVDGKYFYYKKAEELWKMPVNGGEETLVTREKVNFANYWALGNQGLYFLEPREAEHKAILKLFRFETGQSSQIAVLDQPVPRSNIRLSLPADGRWLLYDQVDRHESDIMLIENFR